VAKFRLRYQSTDLEMPVGEFVIGRSSSCSLALDDGLVSRRHAVLHATADHVDVEDLGSRNGVMVNGKKVEGLTRLKHLDRVMIGGHELVLVEVERTSRPQRDTSMLMRCEKCGMLLQAADSFCSGCGAELSPRSQTLPGATLDLKLSDLPPASGAGPGGPGSGHDSGFSLLASIADKALALSRFAEAERMLQPHLDKALERALTGKPLDASSLARAPRYALKLAHGLRSAPWVDWFFRFHTALRLVPSGQVVDELHELVRAIGYRDARALHSYLAEIQATREDLSPADRFIVSRLESLERVIRA